MSQLTLRAAVIQQRSFPDKNQSLVESERLLAELTQQHQPQLVLLQELHTTHYFCQTEDSALFDLAEPLDGPSAARLSALAKKYSCVLVGGIFEKRAPGVFHNTALVFEPDGSLAGYYRKMHIPDDPAFYEKMSELLDEIIALRKAKAIEYEEYLKRIADLARGVEAGLTEDTPEQLKSSPALRALYNNLKTSPAPVDRVAEPPGEYEVSGDPTLKRALEIDAAVKRVRPDGWRGVQAREQVIKQALYDVLQDVAEVERIFLIIKAQSEY